MSELVQDGGAGHADRKGIFGWMMFDWATQPFHTAHHHVRVRAVFRRPCCRKRRFGTTDLGLRPRDLADWQLPCWPPSSGQSQTVPGRANRGSCFSPWSASLGCWLLWYSVPGSSSMTLVIAGLVLGLIGMEFAAVFNNAMMPELVPTIAAWPSFRFGLGAGLRRWNRVAGHRPGLHVSFALDRQDAVWPDPPGVRTRCIDLCGRPGVRPADGSLVCNLCPADVPFHARCAPQDIVRQRCGERIAGTLEHIAGTAAAEKLFQLPDLQHALP